MCVYECSQVGLCVIFSRKTTDQGKLVCAYICMMYSSTCITLKCVVCVCVCAFIIKFCVCADLLIGCTVAAVILQSKHTIC